MSPTECLLISKMLHSQGRYRMSSSRVLLHRTLDNILLFFRVCNGTTFTVFNMIIFVYNLVGNMLRYTLNLAVSTRDLIFTILGGSGMFV